MPNPQLQLDLEGSHATTGTEAFKAWLLSIPPTPWWLEDDEKEAPDERPG